MAGSGPVETRFGLLDVVEGRDQYENGLSLNGNQIDGVEGNFDVTHVFDWGNKGDVVQRKNGAVAQDSISRRRFGCHCLANGQSWRGLFIAMVSDAYSEH